MLVMDSGLGGISVVRALRAQTPQQPLSYLADTAFFPYGGKSAETLSTRAVALISALHQRSPTGTVVLACNTLSTLCLGTLRAALPQTFVGTVPAIKVAAARSRSKRFTMLGTPNTAHSSYTKNLIAEFAAGCMVDTVAAPHLAELTETLLLGNHVTDEQIRAELAPAFIDDAFGRTDAVVLGCTHYPLIVGRLRACAPWDVEWIDSGDAIARRALSLVEGDTAPKESIAYVTAEADIARYDEMFKREGFDRVEALVVS